MKLVLINIFILLGLLTGIEIAGRSYHALTNEEGTFFRESTFVSPWFTTFNRPAPDIAENAGPLTGLFNHQQAPTAAVKPDNLLRIIAIGGSTTRNQTAWRWAKTDYAAELQKRLQPSFPDHQVEVLNAGGEGFSSAHSLVNYALRLSAFQPDLIIVMHNENDRSAAYFGEATLPDYANKYMHPTYLAPETQRFRGLYGTAIQSRVLSGLGAAKALAVRELDFDADLADANAYFARNLRNLALLAMADNTDVLLLSQPYDPARVMPKLLAGHDRFNRTVMETTSDTGTGYLDMHGLLGGQAAYFTDTIHYSVEGVTAFAEALAPTVADSLKMRILR
jgi:lysophospholipase L1-like esterase